MQWSRTTSRQLPCPKIHEQRSYLVRPALCEGHLGPARRRGAGWGPVGPGRCVQGGCLWNETRCDLHKLECGRFTEQMIFQPCVKAPEQLLHISGVTTGRHTGFLRVPGATGVEITLRTAFFSRKDSFFTVSLPWKESALKKSNTPKLEILLIDNKIISRAKPATAQWGNGARLPSRCPLWARCVTPWALSQGTIPRTALLNQKLGAFGTEKNMPIYFAKKCCFLC